VLVVDDAQWADQDSLRALLFALRRLNTQPVLTVLVTRSGEARLPEGLVRLAESRTGLTLPVGPMSPAEVKALAEELGVTEFPAPAADRLCAHTLGNPRHVTAMLAETPIDRWRTWEPRLPAPRMFSRIVSRRLAICGDDARRLIEATAVLGEGAELTTTSALAGLKSPLAALEEACLTGLLQACEPTSAQQPGLAHPMVQAAVYGQLSPTRRAQLHVAAARLVDDEWAALRHRASATQAPDAALAAELTAFAARLRDTGAHLEAACALMEGSRLSTDREQREQRLLYAVNLFGDAGRAADTGAFAHELAAIRPGPLLKATAGYLALLRGHAGEAHGLLCAAWTECGVGRNSGVRALVSQRSALHATGRLRSHEVVEWARRAVELSGPDDSVRLEAQALLGLGLGWQRQVPPLHRTEIAESLFTRAGRALALDVDDDPEIRTLLAAASCDGRLSGSVWFAVWSSAWLARAAFAAGAWDEAAAHAQRATSLVAESGHQWLRPLAHCAAVLVPAARGEWAAAQEHSAVSAQPGDYPLTVVPACVAAALLATARGQHEEVLRALEPVLRTDPDDAAQEPQLWPWQDLYADALVSAGRLADAEAFLVPHEELAAARRHGSMVARLARVRGRLAAANGQLPAAETAFGRAATELKKLDLPFQQALLDLAHGQALRRARQRRAAADKLSAARERFDGLRAWPYVERCEQELAGCGLAPAKRTAFDPSRLTAQELVVARLVALGMSNRQVASELFISIKTVQFHLTHIYAKLAVSSRAELAAQFRDSDMD
jgi:DNA-binding CsgD family transcriptional regulator/tetratricopeptide (TPR) repeat protein